MSGIEGSGIPGFGITQTLKIEGTGIEGGGGGSGAAILTESGSILTTEAGSPLQTE